MSTRFDFFVGLLFGLAVTLGFWFGPDLYRWWSSPAIEPAAVPEAFETGTRPELARPVEPVTERVRAPKTVARGPDPAVVLKRKAGTCSFWSQRANDDAGKLYRDRACRAMRNYAERTGQALPRITGSTPSSTRATRKRPGGPASIAVYVHECTEHRRGSLDYRRCRAREAKRLKNVCQQHRHNERWAAADRWCGAYDTYRVVD